MKTANKTEEDERPSRSEVAEYVHDLAGQLADMAGQFGLANAAEALKQVQLAVEREL
ncbi:MAG: hypothetical protein AB7T59_00635 [Hyphomonadaceae bacterium]